MHKIILTFFLVVFSLSIFAQKNIKWFDANELLQKGYYQNHGITKEQKRYGIVFKNTTDHSQSFVIRLNNPHLNFLYLTRVNGDTIYKTGDHLNFSTRPIVFWDFALPVQVNSRQADSLILTLDKRGENLIYRIQVLKPKDFENTKTLEIWLNSVFFSISVFAAGVFLLLGFLKKENIHSIFAGFILISAAWILNNNGVWFQLIWPSEIYFQKIARTLFSTLSIGLFMLYMYRFYYETLTKFMRTFYIFSISFFVLRLVVVVFNQNILNDTKIKSILLIMSAFIIFLILTVILYSISSKMKNKKFQIQNIGFSIYFFYVFNEGFKQVSIDIAPGPEFDHYSSFLYYLLPIGLISFANIQNYRQNKKRKTEIEIENAHKKHIEISEKIFDAQEYEKSTIGKNIHDQVGGLISVVKIKLEILKKKRQNESIASEMDQLIQILHTCSDELHNIVDDLVPPEFNENSLATIIKNRLEIFQNATEINFSLNSNFDEPMDEKFSLKIYRIVCELITNAIRHSNCTNVLIEINKKGNYLYLKFQDNGIGFKKTSMNNNHGIRNIENRVNFLAGKLKLESSPGNTEYNIEIPLQ